MYYSRTMTRLSPLTLQSVLLICVLIVTLAACAHPIPTPATSLSSLCERPRLTFSRLHDTDEMIKQIKAQNAARDTICGKGK